MVGLPRDVAGGDELWGSLMLFICHYSKGLGLLTFLDRGQYMVILL